MNELDIKNWLLNQQKKKFKWWNQNILRQNLNAYEKKNLHKVYGKLQQMDETLKFMGVPRKERFFYQEKELEANKK